MTSRSRLPGKDRVVLRPSGRRSHWVAAASVALVAVLVYLPSLSLGFVNWDDDLYVYGNPHLEGSLWNVLTWAFTSG